MWMYTSGLRYSATMAISKYWNIRRFLLISIVTNIITSIIPVNCEEAILRDTRAAISDLGWTVAQNSKWMELTNTNQNGEERRTYQVCEIQKPNQDNWVRTQFIPVHGAQRIYVEIEFTIRSCEDVRNVKTCKETFNLYYYESDRDEATSTYPSWTEGPYVKIDTIAADKRFKPGSPSTNFETRNIGPISKAGIYLAMQDTGACMTLMHVRVYYKYCAPTMKNLARFPRTITGDELTTIVPAEGTCVAHSITDGGRRPLYHCNAKGEWDVPSGACMCEAGYQNNSEFTSCIACNAGSYKSEVGNHACKKCPHYSKSSKRGATVCQCLNGYYRADSDPPSMECTKPPSGPTNLVSIVNNTSVSLHWDAPVDDGGRYDVVYSIKCFRCQLGFVSCDRCSGGVDFTPNQEEIKTTSAKATDLSAYAFYKFQVLATNGVSELASKNGAYEVKLAEVQIETNQAAPSVVRGVRPVEVTHNTALIDWNSPEHTNGQIIEYEVLLQTFDIFDQENQPKYDPNSPTFNYRVDDHDSNQQPPSLLNRTTEQTIQMTGLQPNTEYVIKVRARTMAGYGPYSIPTKITTKESDPGDNQGQQENSSMQMFIAVGGALFLFVAVIAIAVFCTRRRRKSFHKNKSLDIEKQPMFGREYSAHKTYVDPTTYEDPHRAVLDFTKEIDASCIKIEQVIGGGEFGDVCKGVLSLQSKAGQIVAIKTLKAGYSTQQKLDFLGEASIMGQFDHPNVIHLEGVVTKSRPIMIVTEFMENGSLDAFLRDHDDKLSVIQLVRMMRHIASGMRCLSDMGYVHRDLAARNILIDESLVCKVSDFGLSRVLEDDEDASYTTRGGKIPIRWTAPEAITYRKFTSASDVWSFGIVMWEVMSYGERPYWGMSNQDVIQAVGSGYRLPAPMYCPQVLHQLMIECWKKDRGQRPKFNSIVQSLDSMLREPSKLNDIACSEKRRPSGTIISRQTSHQSHCSNSGHSTSSSRTTTPSVCGLTDDGRPSPQGTINNHEDIPMNSLSPPVYNLSNSLMPVPERPSSLGSWLDMVGLAKYKENFTKNGCSSLEQVLQLTANELSRMGIASPSHQDRLLDSIRGLREPHHGNGVLRNSSARMVNGNGFAYQSKQKRSSAAEAPPQYQEICSHNGIPV